MAIRMSLVSLAPVTGLLLLAACGGGGLMSETSEGIPLGYSNTGDVRHSYTPYMTRSHAYRWSMGDGTVELNVGGDLEPRETLRHVSTAENGIRYFMGASRDGVGVDRLKNYEYDLATQNGSDPYMYGGDGFFPFRVQPQLYLDPRLLEPENVGTLRALYNSVQILNDALPPEFQIVIADTRSTDTAYSGEIVVSLESRASIGAECGSTAVACAYSNHSRKWNSATAAFNRETDSSVVYIPDDFDTSQYMHARKVIVHELLHALGIWGHVDSVEFPDSIMGTTGEYIPNPGYIISKIDREVLQIMYMNQRTDLYNDWGEWSDTSFHVMGRTEDGALHFGVALFNGLPQPWTSALFLTR